ncbi:MAG: metalloregulator ArsR/SmtB family transcription factor [Spirochaetales bacterium]|nr:metalloregulator ArsR/SmtB family transcription factor [Spirochaetales bacterium]
MDSTLSNKSDFFKALGDETRLKILRIIGIGDNRLCVGAIARQLAVSQPAVSQHLKILKNAGLVRAEREGYHIHYSVVVEGGKEWGMNLEDLLGSLREDWSCPCGGDESCHN